MILNLNDIGILENQLRIDCEPVSFGISVERRTDCTCVRITCRYMHVFGMGERFDILDQAGQTTEVRVQEKFTRQGKLTYLPVPFFFTDSGLGIYIDTCRVTEFAFEGVVSVKLPFGQNESLPDLHYFAGTPGEILQGMSALLGMPPLPPRWTFGPWMSANRWSSQAIVESQAQTALSLHIPASVLVIEAWSDESTFYLWNDARYRETPGEEPLTYEDLTYPEGARWPNPEDMIKKLHENGIRLILWQVPVLKKLEPGRSCRQHEMDIEFALEHSYVVMNADGTPYVIPEGHWFAGSFVPDFTRPETRDWWFSKRRYLTESGVDGFKTDGGEFIYDESTLFYSGQTGKEMINNYPALYTEAYSAYNRPDQTLFSRAGYTRSRTSPIHWAGDQISTWDEMRQVLTAGLSAGLSGITYWSFDIAGFAGPMPDAELYSRCVQWAVFAPVMQWHSEPVGGQFSELMASSEMVNDRSPWNIASYYGRPELLDEMRFHFALRMNLLPSIYSFAIDSSVTGLPMMRPLMIEFPKDKHVYEVDDEYILGSILIAPILAKGAKEREVYLPDGSWISLWKGENVTGPASITASTGDQRIPAFIRSGKALLVDLDDGCAPGIWEKNGMADSPSSEDTLYLALAGETGEDTLHLDCGRSLFVRWDREHIALDITDAGKLTGKDTSICRTAVLPVVQDSLRIPIYLIKELMQ